MPMLDESVLARSVAARHCPLCGESGRPNLFAEARIQPEALDHYAFASRKNPEIMHWRLWECGECDLLYANPAPAAEQLAGLYRDAAFSSAVEARYAARTYGRLLTRILPQLPDRTGALDIGTGDGAFLKELLDRGFSSVIGIEPSSAPIQSASDRIRPLIYQGLFESGAFPANQFSLVSCFQTIEHLSDPARSVLEMHRILKPGGAVFLVGHNRRAISAKLLGRRSPIFDIEHLQLFSMRSLRLLLESAGFRSVTVSTFVNRYPLRYWSQMLPLPKRKKALVLDCLAASGAGRIAAPLPAGNLMAFGFK